jgi:hypothetical protein
LVTDNTAQCRPAQRAQGAAVGQYCATQRAYAGADCGVAIAVRHMPACSDRERSHYENQHAGNTFNVHKNYPGKMIDYLAKNTAINRSVEVEMNVFLRQKIE